MVVKSSSLTITLILSGGDSSRFFNSLANCLMKFGGRFSLIAFEWTYHQNHKRGKNNLLQVQDFLVHTMKAIRADSSKTWRCSEVNSTYDFTCTRIAPLRDYVLLKQYQLKTI
jgi:hypothetical protein